MYTRQSLGAVHSKDIDFDKVFADVSKQHGYPFSTRKEAGKAVQRAYSVGLDSKAALLNRCKNYDRSSVPAGMDLDQSCMHYEFANAVGPIFSALKSKTGTQSGRSNLPLIAAGSALAIVGLYVVLR